MLEGRHVIGLFLGVILLSGLFFTLGYVMGRNEAQAPVSADDFREKPIQPKQEALSKRTNKAAPSETPATDTNAAENSEWEFYHAGDNTKEEDRLKPESPAPAKPTKSEPSVVKTTGSSRSSGSAPKNSAGPAVPGGAYTLQVAAMIKEADAFEVAKQLQKKKFPAFVLSPHGDKYYRVQVGPYADQKAAEAARKGLEGAGFKAIVKH